MKLADDNAQVAWDPKGNLGTIKIMHLADIINEAVAYHQPIWRARQRLDPDHDEDDKLEAALDEARQPQGHGNAKDPRKESACREPSPDESLMDDDVEKSRECSSNSDTQITTEELRLALQRDYEYDEAQRQSWPPPNRWPLGSAISKPSSPSSSTLTRC